MSNPLSPLFSGWNWQAKIVSVVMLDAYDKFAYLAVDDTIELSSGWTQ